MRWLALILPLLAAAPMLHPLYFWGAHDGRHSVYFLVEFERSVQDGIWWPRWAPDFAFGYGYPIFNIYAPGAYFLGQLLRFVGFGHVDAVKIVFAGSLVGSSLSMWWFAKGFAGARAGLVAAALYVYAPYRLVDIYVRGALSESVAFVFFPLILGGIRRVVIASRMQREFGRAAANPLPGAVILALSAAALVLTHNGATILFAPVAAAYAAWLLGAEWVAGARAAVAGDRQLAREAAVLLRSRILPPALWLGAAGAYALALSAVFWLPMALEYRDVRTDQWTTADYDYRANFVYPHQLVSPVWGYGVSLPGPDDTMPLQLGIVPLTLGIAAATRRGDRSLRFFFGALALLATFALTPASEPLWTASGFAGGLVQFPWRVLTITTLALAALGCLAFGRDDPDSSTPQHAIAVVTAIAATLIAAYPWLNPPMIEPPEGPVSLGALMRFEQSSGELVGLTRWNRVKPNDSPLKPLYEAGLPILTKVDPATVPPGASAATLNRSSVFEEIAITAPAEFRLGLRTQFYPGWIADLDGGPVAIEPMGDLGLQTVLIPAGSQRLVLRFVDTWPRTVGQSASLGAVAFGLVGAGVYGFRRLRRA